MKRSVAIQKGHSPPAPMELDTASLNSDPHWVLARRVVEGPHFARSTLLSKFLLYVVSETLAGRPEAISEHKIGVAVFGRPSSYRTDDDNIVRNYARQLRKRLAEHFSGIGSTEPVRIDIPVGGYTPSFVSASADIANDRDERQMPEESLPAGDSETDRRTGGGFLPWGIKRPIAARGVWVLLGIALLAGMGWMVRNRLALRHTDAYASRVLWRAILAGPGNTLIVPPDVGFNLLEDMSHKSIPLARYIKGGFADASDERANLHAEQDLRSQQYTDFVSMQIAVAIARQPEFDPQRVFLRFPRELRIDDLKTANAVIIGSVSSNPWAGLVDSNANFHIVPSPDMESAEIVNAKPSPGEAPVYVSHWNEPAHETYAVILFLPNLNASGHVLVVEGLDVAGTQAAAELLFHPGVIASTLKAAKRSDGTLRPFEVLLRATSIESNAAGTQIIASRIH